jgi:acetyl-CoA carboxylase biotin carboxylase subunit
MFRRLLIANRGEVAVRIARACRALSIAPVAVASRADLGSSWLEGMDDVVCIGGAAPSASYLRMESVVQAALQTGCAAVHPGWGFLAENARFAALCAQHGLTFVGPRPEVMEKLGLKWPAKAAMRRAGLAGIPGSEGLLEDAEHAAEAARSVGYPVILKADSGGGGRGMRHCANEGQLREAFGQASAEALAAFGDGALYLERYLEGGRHIEVQLLADRFGGAVHLFERECSIQRNHQKLIEESPSPVIGAAQREQIGRAAARAAAQIGYTGAGTIEFLRTPDDGQLCFMEMNTRLQVEHPVSELVSGVDIVREQLRIAANHPLGVTQESLRISGHALECRINAEDPRQGFRPTPGRLDVFELPSDVGPGTLRVDTHLVAGERVSPHYDSLIAKLITHAPSRDAAIETMLHALRGTRIEGVATTIPVHLAVLESAAFQSGDYDTASLPGWSPDEA